LNPVKRVGFSPEKIRILRERTEKKLLSRLLKNPSGWMMPKPRMDTSASRYMMGTGPLLMMRRSTKRVGSPINEMKKRGNVLLKTGYCRVLKNRSKKKFSQIKAKSSCTFGRDNLFHASAI
jgi:hypothetical protein